VALIFNSLVFFSFSDLITEVISLVEKVLVTKDEEGWA
jgi:hypothetical protein